MLTDRFGRDCTGIRISLTDRCNFDCVYCHNEGLGDTRGPRAPTDEELTVAEIGRLLDVAAAHGVSSVAFTGGEPMLRADLADIVRAVPDAMAVSMTTNGSMLPERAATLADAGLDRVNVSLDALDPETFAGVTGSSGSDRVREGVRAAVAAGLTPVKLNVVVVEQTVETVPEMVDHVVERDGVWLQLIEYMPDIAGRPEWAIDIDRVHDWLADRADRIETREMHDRTRYHVGSDPGGVVEVVDPVGNPTFCKHCERVRVTPDGAFSGCLNRSDDRRSPADWSRDAIADALEATVAERVPYYGEYLIEQDGEWVQNPAFVVPGDRPPADAPDRVDPPASE